jgi:tetratricopeptide (TPR) repeat protein
VSLDPGYGAAHAGAAECYFAVAIFNLRDPRDVLSKAHAAARLALDLDDSLGDAHNLLGCVEGMLNYRWSEAERRFKRALELNFGSVLRLGHAVWHLLPIGDTETAIAECEKVVDSDPLHLLARTAYASVLYMSRNYRAAEQQCMRALEIDPTFPQALQMLVHLQVSQDRLEEAMRSARQLERHWGESPLALCGLALAQAAMGERGSSLALARKIEGLPESWKWAVQLSRICVALDDREAALECLERAVEYRVPQATWLKTIPWADPLRSDLRYEKLLRKINL